MHTVSSIKRFLLVAIIPHTLTDWEAHKNIDETKSLIDTYGGEIVDVVLQRREVHDKGRYVGKGKTEEIAQKIVDENIDVVVFNAIINPHQLYEFQEIFEKRKLTIQVWDRVDLILKIFSLHANTAEAKLQIELAAMRHMGPRIYGMGSEMSRQSGMLGTRGIGETNTELMRRHWRTQIKKTKDELARLSSSRLSLIERRHRVGIPSISLIGYTNAGKTSLFNLLTKKDKLVKNALFATLDTTVGKVYLQGVGKEVLISDTIGFIRNLPPKLVDAFRSTLTESIHADLLLHVIDASDDDMERKIKVVEKVLWGLGLHYKPSIYVFNKIDAVQDIDTDTLRETYKDHRPIFISVKTGEGIEELKQLMGQDLLSFDSTSRQQKQKNQG